MEDLPSGHQNQFAIACGKILDDGFVLLNQTQEIVMANAMATRYLGENLLGQTIEDVIIAPQFQDDFNTCIDLHKTVEFVAGTQHDNRQRYRIRMHMIDDAAIGLLIMDMTLQHNLEKVRRDFVANVSHELRSPLTSLIGFIETMQSPMEIDPAARKKFLGIMDEEARRMSRLIDDLLSLSRVETEEHISPEDQVAVDKVVRSVITSVSNRAQKVDKTIFFQDQSGLGLDEVKIHGDHDELMEVFHNLLDNALKYGFDRSDVQVVMTTPDPQSIAFTIINKGEGIEEKHLSRLTERFYRADKGRSRQMGGTGLGLAIVKHIINRHRGTIHIESEMNKETRFTVTLPRIG